MSEKVINNLLEQKSALGRYLDEMLHQATEATSKTPAEIAAEKDIQISPPGLVQVQEEIEHRQNLIEEPVSFEIAEESTQAPGVIESFEVDESEFPLQCLMFRVGDNLLAIPLTALNSVVNWQDRLTRLPGEPDWMMGILKHREKNVRVIDSAKVLQIKRESAKLPEFILVLDDENCGISCDQIDKVVSLNYDDIQWCRNQVNRMAMGTIRDSLSRLLNPKVIVKCLSN